MNPARAYTTGAVVIGLVFSASFASSVLSSCDRGDRNYLPADGGSGGSGGGRGGGCRHEDSCAAYPGEYWWSEACASSDTCGSPEAMCTSAAGAWEPAGCPESPVYQCTWCPDRDPARQILTSYYAPYTAEGAARVCSDLPACTGGGSSGGSGACRTDCDCGRCWYCESGTCRYGGEGPSGCYRGCGG